MEIPSTMKAIALAAYGTPATYDIATLDTPKITQPDQVLIKVYYASINPVDVKFASGMAKAMMTETFPYTLGYDASGIILATGTAVQKFQPGDEVFTRAPTKGSLAEYHLSTEAATAHKPPTLSWAEAAATPLVALTSFQAMKAALFALGIQDFRGKTVLVAAALSGTGMFAVQLAKNVFGAERVVATASTGKVVRVPELFGEGVVDQIVDYTRDDPVKVIGHGQVDYFYDTAKATLSYLPVMRKGGIIESISTVPSGSTMKALTGPGLPWYVFYPLNLVDWFYTWRVGRYGVKYEYFIMHPDGKDLAEIGQYIVNGKIRVVVGREADLNDIEAVRAGCQEVFDAKGGIGKFVIKVASDSSMS